MADTATDATETDLDKLLKSKTPYSAYPARAAAAVGSESRHATLVLRHALTHQLPYTTGLVSSFSSELAYYQSLVLTSLTSLLLFPYHLGSPLASVLGITPFSYYSSMLESLMAAARSYDSLPNFTAADVLRLTGIGRNQYIAMMNVARARDLLAKRSRSRPVGVAERVLSALDGTDTDNASAALLPLPGAPEAAASAAIVPERALALRPPPDLDRPGLRSLADLLPTAPPPEFVIHYWWIVEATPLAGPARSHPDLSDSEIDTINSLLATGHTLAGRLDAAVLVSLYRKALVIIHVPVGADDTIHIPPLQGFVMNRVKGDPLETLLYAMFVASNRITSLGDLAAILDAPLASILAAAAFYMRIGIAHKGLVPPLLEPSEAATGSLSTPWHSSWVDRLSASQLADAMVAAKTATRDRLLREPRPEPGLASPLPLQQSRQQQSGQQLRRVGLVFDATLPAFLMMGNLSQGLKPHAVTLFEVGKLSDEAMDAFVAELGSANAVTEGEVRTYYEHTQTLHATLCALRGPDTAVDLLKCDAVNSLAPQVRARVLAANYDVLVSIAPLAPDARSVVSVTPPHYGPLSTHFTTPWLRAALYAKFHSGLPSLILPCGRRLKSLPPLLEALVDSVSHVWVTPWRGEPEAMPLANCLPLLNLRLRSGPVIIQAFAPPGLSHTTHTSPPLAPSDALVHIPFPLHAPPHSNDAVTAALDHDSHAIALVAALVDGLGLNAACGYLSLVRTASGWVFFDLVLGIPLFDAHLNAAVTAAIANTDILSAEHTAAVYQDVASALTTTIHHFIAEATGAHAPSDIPFDIDVYPTVPVVFDPESMLASASTPTPSAPQ